MRISPRSIVRHAIRVKVALGPEQGTASGDPPLTAPFPNFPADKEEGCQSNKDPAAPNEPLPPDSELCGENRSKKQEPQASDQETSNEFRIVLEIALQIEHEFHQHLEEMKQVRSPQAFFIPQSEGRNRKTGIRLSLALRDLSGLGSFRHHFPVRSGTEPLHDVDLTGVAADQDARLALFDAFQDARSCGFRRGRSDLFKIIDRCLAFAFGGVGSKASSFRDRRMNPAGVNAGNGNRRAFEFVP
jgi:hypothetical protein